MPDLSIEQGFAGPVIGIDEAGRGPWAGPVTVAAAWLHPQAIASLPPGLDDSKKLSPAKRAAFHQHLTSGPHLHALVTVPVAVIDRDGILRATLDAMTPAAARLAERISGAGHGAVAQVLIDGNQMPSGLAAPAQTLVKGDSRSLSIAAASVIAKHERDSLMLALSTAHPGYGWETNMGYGTAAHRDAMARLGVTAHHRRSFAPVREQLASIGDTASTKG
ncbi:MAG: ribonuclease HII [Candidatus Puniceispirillaceae bacterium]